MNNTQALEKLYQAQSVINQAINELHDYRKHGARFTTQAQAAIITSVKSRATRAGLDLSAWTGAD